jgi:hypothetical protein
VKLDKTEDKIITSFFVIIIAFSISIGGSGPFNKKKFNKQR